MFGLFHWFFSMISHCLSKICIKIDQFHFFQHQLTTFTFMPSLHSYDGFYYEKLSYLPLTVWVTTSSEFGHKDWLETHWTLHQSDVWTKDKKIATGKTSQDWIVMSGQFQTLVLSMVLWDWSKWNISACSPIPSELNTQHNMCRT